MSGLTSETLETKSDYKKLYLLKGLNYHFSSKKKVWQRKEGRELGQCSEKRGLSGYIWKVKVKVTQYSPWNSPGQKYWNRYPFPSPGDLPNPGIEPRSPGLQAYSLPAEPQGKPENTGEGSLSLLQQIFPTQESNWGLLHCRQILYQLSYEGILDIFGS